MPKSRAGKIAAAGSIVLVLALAASLWYVAVDPAEAGAGGKSKFKALTLSLDVFPTRIMEGEEVRAAASISLLGGPGPVQYWASIPRSEGGYYEGSVTIMMGVNDTYGFDLPVKGSFSPGAYDITVTVTAGNLVETRTVELIVDPNPVDY